MESAIKIIEIKNGGFRKRTLTHRDYLGALLGMGIDRRVLGDIVIPDGDRAFLFCDPTAAGFLINEMTSVGTEKVRVAEAVLPDGFEIKKNLSPVTGTVASARLDCVVAELTNLSRERAQELIRSGYTELDYEAADKPDRLLFTPCTLSVRGYGKYIINDLGTETKKGRIRLIADRYV